MGEITQDLRSGVRMLARHPSSTALITGLLALGIGACTVVFILFDAVFLRSLPVRQPRSGEKLTLTELLCEERK